MEDLSKLQTGETGEYDSLACQWIECGEGC